MHKGLSKINLVVIPFHDWKKCEQEGFRTRDAHLLLELAKKPEINQILVIDRPISVPEMLLKRRRWKVSQGEILYRRKNMQLTSVAPKIAVLDILLHQDLVKPLSLRKRWWTDVFKREAIHRKIREAIHHLDMPNYGLLAFTPLAYGLINKIGENYRLFFAVDNWLVHPQMQQVAIDVKTGYQKFAASSDVIITTSESLKGLFEPMNANIHFIPNGVNPELFTNQTFQQARRYLKHSTTNSWICW